MTRGAATPRSEREIAEFELETEVVIVGQGCAGACAALAAREAGAEVLALERASAGGGTSALSGGLIYLGGGTPVQRACGFDDSPEEMQKFLEAALGPAPDLEKIRQYCEHSVEHFHWLVAHGVPFRGAFYPEPSMEAPDDSGLVYSGGEDTHPFDQIARPAPRGHKPRAAGAAGGFLMQRLLEAVETSGARVEPDLRAETLVIAADGSVVGIIGVRAGRELAVRARRGVVLAAGGFIQNPEMVAHHAPLLAGCSWKLGVDGDDGRAIRMGQGAGGSAIRMDAGEVAIPLTPPRRLMRGILVNASGQRFINEDAYYGRIGQASLFHQNGRIWLVLDEATYERNLAGMQAAYVAATVDELERELAVPEGSLAATLALYNRHAAANRDPLFHKAPEFLQPLVKPPYAAIDCSTSGALYATFTLGGLWTRPSGEVLDPDGAPVPGLYAAGRTSSGLAAFGYCSGISLGDGTFFGRHAGTSAALRR
jgi:3-oxo-5alpha-steroid 4-dehydrogenase